MKYADKLSLNNSRPRTLQRTGLLQLVIDKYVIGFIEVLMASAIVLTTMKGALIDTDINNVC